MRSTASRNWKVQGVTFQEVYISMEDAFQALKDGLGFNDSHDTFLCVREGKLMRGEDVSHHGSPLYDYTEVSNNPKWAELYQAFERLEEYMKYADSPQWERHLESEQEESQNGPSSKPSKNPGPSTWTS